MAEARHKHFQFKLLNLRSQLVMGAVFTTVHLSELCYSQKVTKL